MGSIFERNGVFYLSYKDASGKWVKRSAGKDWALAERRLAEAVSSPPRAKDSALPVCPFPLAAEEYLKRLEVYGKPSSIRFARLSIKRLREFFGTQDLGSLRPSDLDSYVLKRRADGVSNSSINGELVILRTVLNHAVQADRLPKVPVKVRLLKLTRRIPKVLSKEQVETLLASAEGRVRPIVLTALHTGFRLQELIYLNWSDVDFATRTIRVTAKPDLGFSPKAHAERTSPMSDRLVQVLGAHRENVSSGPDDPVFQMKPGVRWTSRLISVMRRTYKRAGLYSRECKSGLHQMRRTFASTLLDSGVSIEAVRQLGGWASVGIVQTYVTAADKVKREAVENLPF